MPTVMGHHDVLDSDHWLASQNAKSSSARSEWPRSEPLSPTDRTSVALLMDVPDWCAHGRDGNP